MYHRVAVSDVDPWDLCVSPQNFDAQLAVLAERRTATMDEVADGRCGPRSVVVTIDDGYEDTVDAALPIIERRGVPVTVYVTTQGIAGESTFWWDDLADLVFGLTDDEVAPLAEDLDLRLPGECRSREDLHLAIWERLVVRTPDAQRRAIVGMEQTLERQAAPAATLLDDRGLDRLNRSDLVTLGGHTRHHAALPELAERDRRREVADAVESITALTGRTLRHFAYPYGRYDDRSVETVRVAGFDTAVTTDPGPVPASADPFRLPRFQVTDVDGPAFDRFLDDIFAGARA